MIRYSIVGDGVEIHVNGALLGKATRNEGLYISPSLMKNWVQISSGDLLQITRKVSEVNQYGSIPLRCTKCGGTPYFPIAGGSGVLCWDETFHPQQAFKFIEAVRF